MSTPDTFETEPDAAIHELCLICDQLQMCLLDAVTMHPEMFLLQAVAQRRERAIRAIHEGRRILALGDKVK